METTYKHVYDITYVCQMNIEFYSAMYIYAIVTVFVNDKKHNARSHAMQTLRIDSFE